ncbi:unnamed protein product [Caenorhabditis brenneri]
MTQNPFTLMRQRSLRKTICLDTTASHLNLIFCLVQLINLFLHQYPTFLTNFFQFAWVLKTIDSSQQMISLCGMVVKQQETSMNMASVQKQGSPKTKEFDVTTKETPYTKVDSPNDLKRICLVGQGAYGKVYQVQNKTDHKIYALKVITKKAIKKHHLADETFILETVKSPFICKMFQSFDTLEKLYFVLEFIPGGDFFSLIEKIEVMSEGYVTFYLAEIVVALEHLHNHHIIYRDLKPDNIMLDRKGHVKLTDFGMCKLNMYEGAKTTTFCGTLEYMSPEMVKREPYDKSVDLWALGVLMYLLIHGEEPFYGKTKPVLKEQIVSAPIPIPENLSQDGRVLLKRLLTRNPEKRITIPEIKSLDFFFGLDWQKLMMQEYEPPLKPSILNERDVSNFSKEFTSQKVNNSPIKCSPLETMNNYFENFDTQLL